MAAMVFDPGDVNMAIRAGDLRLMYRAVDEKTGMIEWVPLDEIRKAQNHRDDDFTRPAW
jgi:RIO-like serine/threonine protein kinase